MHYGMVYVYSAKYCVCNNIDVQKVQFKTWSTVNLQPRVPNSYSYSCWGADSMATYMYLSQHMLRCSLVGVEPWRMPCTA